MRIIDRKILTKISDIFLEEMETHKRKNPCTYNLDYDYKLDCFIKRITGKGDL